MEKWRCLGSVGVVTEEVLSIAWRPQTMEFATGCKDGSSQVWKVQSMMGKVSVQLVWRTGLSIFTAVDAVVADSPGLSPVNRQLLLQRGANDRSLPSVEVECVEEEMVKKEKSTAWKRDFYQLGQDWTADSDPTTDSDSIADSIEDWDPSRRRQQWDDSEYSFHSLGEEPEDPSVTRVWGPITSLHFSGRPF